MQPSEAQRIVQAYGAVLGESTAIGVVRDIRSLPYSKAQIKVALLFALKADSDKMMRSHLIAGYVSLADFQTLSDDQIDALYQWQRAIGGSQISDDAETKSAAATISKFGRQVIALQKCVSEESKLLAPELKATGFA